ncbi:glycosyltransferase family 2 protein [Methanosarcina sp.]|uniref:glycosyltransferase family 2 protein n=1 Tax=Methanosarcina sp. TaxID=2213 RepID=UPI003C75B3EF
MKISIALCTYNGARFLQEQLESIALQTRAPDEMIICDDQSKDNTLELLRNFASKASFPVHVILNEKNLGSTRNFEKAIKLCTGDIIFLSDQDDVWHPDKLDKIEKLFSISPSTALIFTDAEVVDENLRSLGYSLWQSIGFSKKEQSHFTDGKFLEVLLKRNVVTGSTMAFRSEFKKLFFPIPDIWVHDGWIALLIAFASDLNIISEPLIKYRQHRMQQVGAGDEPFNLHEKMNRKIEQFKNLKSSLYNFQPECARYKLAYEHLVNSQFPSLKINKIPHLKARFSHFCVRTNLPVSRRKRVPLVLKELLKMNYHRYSNGIFSFSGDLLRDNTRIR